MKRLIYVTLAFLVGCNGMGSAGSRFVPAGPIGGAGTANGLAAANLAAHPIGGARRGRTKILFRMRIPKRHKRERALAHPSTISSATQSVGIGINGAAQQVFNTTPSSAGCTIGAGGTTCTFAMNAPLGSDTFSVSTYSAVGGGGTILDHGSAVFNVVRGKVNTPLITLGPVVSSTANSGMGSLRYAIGAANAGDTIMFLLPTGSTLVLTSPITISNDVSVAGPGVTASVRRNGKRSSATYSGVTLSGGNAQQIFVLNVGATMTISGLILAAGKAAVAHQPGGAIYNLGSLTLAGDTFTGNSTAVKTIVRRRGAPAIHHGHHEAKTYKPWQKAPPQPPDAPQVKHANVCPPGTDTYGGAIYNNGTLTISGTTFDGNVAPTVFGCYYGSGGAIYNDVNGVLTSSGDTYTNNSAYYGGAVYNYSEYGSASFTGDTFATNTGCSAASGCATTGCTPGGHCTVYPYGYGGAIYDDYGPGVNVSGSTFSNNAVGYGPDGYGEGGALYLNSGNPSVTGSTFTGNYAGGGTTNCAAGYGGAIVHYSNALELDNDAFTGNVAGGDYYGYGGAIYSDATIHGSGDTFTSNAALGSGSSCETNGYGEGGALFGYFMTLSNSTFTGNQASGSEEGYGGAVYVDDPSTLNGDTFTSNLAMGTGTTGATTYCYGGALYVSANLTLGTGTFASNACKVLGPSADEAEGGAIYNDATLGGTKNAFTSNAASGSGYIYAYAYGGAVGNESTYVSNGETYQSNSASSPYYTYGGAFYNNATLTMTNATFTSNVGSSNYYIYGGALDNGSTATVSNSTFTGNQAVSSGNNGYGGAIYDDSGLTLNASTLSGNSATTGGGGFYSDTTDAINNSTLTGNAVTSAIAYYGGGGLYNDGPTTLTNSTVSGNAVTLVGQFAGGAGVYNDYQLQMYGSTLSGNAVLGSTASSGGGGIFNYDAATIVNSTITGNSSSTDGGGFETYSNSYNPVLVNVTLYQNKAAGSGGNIYNPYTMTLTNSIVAGGSAAAGPDIQNDGTLTSGDYNLIQTAVSGTALAGATTHNMIGVDPLLLALANNGGPTFTNADQATSPGKAAIPFSAGECNGASPYTNVDQRGFARGVATAGKCDVGAYEFGAGPMAVRVPVPAPARETGTHHHRQPHQVHPKPRSTR
jgi:hypothetical protein